MHTQNIRNGGVYGGLIIRITVLLAAATFVASATQLYAQEVVQYNAAQLFTLADAMHAKGDFANAEAVYIALTQDTDLEIRTEARFRLGLLLANNLHRYTDAALQFRRILDDKPSSSRVRVELAKVLAMTGNMRGAERELRAAEAAGLPADVQRMVRFYANALNARKPVGGSFEIALAPDSNINRATRSDTLGTVIGDFTIGQDSQATSGIGLNARTQLYWREGLEPGTDLLVRASTSGNLYRDSRFNDFSAALQVGPQYRSGRDTISVSAGPTWRWYGKQLYSLSYGGNAIWQHPTGKRSQLRIEGGITHIDNRLNGLQVAENFAVNAGLDRALSARLGIGLQAFAFREAARDPGYSLTSGGASAYAC